MNYDHAAAINARRAGPASRVAASIGHALAAWRTLTWSHFGWTIGIGCVGGLAFLLAHGIRRVARVYLQQNSPADLLREFVVAIAASAVMAILFLLAVSVAEHGDRGQPRAWSRYAVAVLVAAGAATGLIHILWPHVPLAGLVGWYELQSQTSIDTFDFANWLLFGGLAVFVYVRLRRARRSQAAFECAELERAAARRRVLRSRLAAIQAQVEPTFLFNTLAQLEVLYEHDALSADRVLDDLIAYLRAALPQLRGEDSTLAHEGELVRAYLRVVQASMGSRLDFAIDIPAELGPIRFPPMLLLPLIDNAVRHGLEPLPLGGRIELRAAVHENRLRLDLRDNGIGDVIEIREGPGLLALRERLDGLYGSDASFSLGASGPHGLTATIELLADVWPELEVVAAAADGIEAAKAIEQHAPDVLFLDIQMPGMTGLEVAHVASDRCHVVFVTAYDQHAVAAFEEGAVDYVMKPINAARLYTACNRVKQRLSQAPANLDHLLTALSKHKASSRPYLRWINASKGAEVQILTTEEICYFQADTKYTRAVMASGEALLRKPLKELLDELDPAMFWQVHRSTIVNLNAISSVARDASGHVVLKLKDRKESLSVSETYAHLFRQM